MIVQLAQEGGLVEGTDYTQGDAFESGGRTYYTAKLLGDPVALTIKVIDEVGFYSEPPHARWNYIAIPHALWMSLNTIQKSYVIGWMYSQEGGVAMRNLFPVAPYSA
jgi:hypothetical protein